MNSFWDFLVWLFWFYVIIACIWIFITVFVDIFRDNTLNGWGKALWVLFLVFLPFLAAFIYLIARGRGMAERNLARATEAQAANADYIRTVAGSSTSSTAAEIEKGKQLLDSGAITQAEFDALKAKALQNA
jgi:ABC-type multidrug transport system fused ATPase/permease subunit